MLTEQENNPFYMMDRNEFKKLAIRYVGGEILSRERDLFGYNDELNTFIIAKKSYNLGSGDYYMALSRLIEKENTEHVLVIALSFNGEFKKKAEEDQQMRVIHITVDDLLKKDYETALPTIIEEMINKNTPLSRVFKPIKK